MEKQIQQAVIAAIKELYGQEIPEKMATLQKTRAEFEGNLTLVVFPFLKMSKKAPEATAEEIGQYLKANCPAVSGYNVVKGFLNLVIGGNAWINVLKDIDADRGRRGIVRHIHPRVRGRLAEAQTFGGTGIHRRQPGVLAHLVLIVGVLLLQTALKDADIVFHGVVDALLQGPGLLGAHGKNGRQQYR